LALTSTVFKAEISVADVDRGYYAEHAVTVARHPSETDERMMVRILAFALHAGERLEFGRGLSAVDEPDLWERDLTGAVELWIEVGQPDGRRLKKASGQAERVVVYAYGGRSAELWWGRTGAEVARLGNLAVAVLSPATTAALAEAAERSMRIQLTVQDGEAHLTVGDAPVPVERTWWKA
jgi:uncharacterized protein YaeQ